MNAQDLPEDSISICVTLSEEGEPLTIAMANVTDSLDEQAKDYLLLMLKGLEFFVHASPEGLASIGNLSELADGEDDDGIMFEPDEELIDAVKDSKVVPINKNTKRIN